MKDKFIRVASSTLFSVALYLDTAILIVFFISLGSIMREKNMKTIAFFVIGLFLIAIGFFTTMEIFKNGVKFGYEEFEFTALDDNNVFKYTEIEKVETYKDTKASMKKGFVKRYSSVILHLKNGEVATVELGITSKNTLESIKKEIERRVEFANYTETL